MEKTTWTKLIVIILLVAAIAAGIYRQWYWGTDGAGPVAAWGVGNLRAGERGYYTNRINNIITNWQNTRRDAERGEEGRFTESYKALLVIDTDKGCMWIEDAGRIQQENHTELPAKMKWTLYHTTPQGSSELAGQTRLKLRGYNSSQQRPEQFHIVGTGRGIGYMDLHFGTNSRGSRSGSGRYNPSVYSSSRKTEDSYPSLIVAEAEYQQYRASVAAAEPNEPIDLSPLEKSRVSWRKVEKLLYQEVEKEVLTAGVGLRSIKIEPGPDYSAAHAEVGVRTEGFFRGIFGGYYWGDVYVKIDRLEDGIWYGADASNPQRPGRAQRQRVDLEFLVCPSAEIPDSRQSELLKKGRRIQRALTTAAPSKWKATLPNGATVQFIGICENPSAGKKWWGPDGTLIEYVPYINTEVYSSPRDDRTMYEMVWKVEFPQMRDGSSGGGTSTRLEGSMGSYSRSVRDRYGNRVLGNFRAEGYSFKKSQKKTTLKIGARVGDGEYERVEFRNISLVANEDQGFEIRVIPNNPPSKWKAALSNGAIVELIGICESPTAGKKWWGPDGTILDYTPYYTTGSSYRPGKDKRSYEMTWRVHYPLQGDSGSVQETKFHIEDSAAADRGSSGERYGDIMRRSYARVYAFDKSRRKATATLDVKVDSRDYERVEFKNISLVPNEDQGFKIELESK